MVYTFELLKNESKVKELKPEEFSDEFYKELEDSILVGMDISISDSIDNISEDERSQFDKESLIVEKFFDLNPGILAEYLKKSYRPAYYKEGKVSIIVLPYFSALKHISPGHADEFVPFDTSTSHFIIVFKKPNKIATIRTDSRNFSLECVQIVMNWVQKIDLGQGIFSLSSDLLDQVIVRLIDEVIDDNVEVIRRFRMNVEFLEQDIMRKTHRPGILDEILKLKGVSMLLYSYTLSEKRFITRLRSSGFPSLNITKDVTSSVQTTLNELDSQIGIINDINGMISDILNIYSLMLQDKLNNIIRILTIFSVIFILPTFIVGFFGMNNFAVTGINPIFTVITVVVLFVSIAIIIIILWRLKVFKRIGL
jgi:Mg2+ and Co2+ transporter CorA